MPIYLREGLDSGVIGEVLGSGGLIVVPSSLHILFLETLLAEHTPKLKGDCVVTLSNLIKNLSGPYIVSGGEAIQMAILAQVLRETNLRYFESVKQKGEVLLEFWRAISLLNKNLISASALREHLLERGSERENDLLVVYSRYEEKVSKIGMCTEGDELRHILEHIEEITLPSTLVFLGFDLLPPAVTKLIYLTSTKRSQTKIYIVRPNPPLNGPSKALAPIFEENLKELGQGIQKMADVVQNSPEGEKDIFLTRLRTMGEEARYIIHTISKILSEGAKKIALITSHPKIRHEIVRWLAGLNLFPARLQYKDGLANIIRREVKEARSIREIDEMLERRFLPGLKEALRNDLCPVEASSNIYKIARVLNEMSSVRDYMQDGLDLNTYKNIISYVLEDVDDQEYINWPVDIMCLRWGDTIYGGTHVSIIPSFYQGNMPPELSSSPFFQDTSFLPANAPLFFTILFPQTETRVALAAYKLNEYILSSKDAVYLTYPALDESGSETYPSPFATIINYKELSPPAHLPIPYEPAEDRREHVAMHVKHELDRMMLDREERPEIIKDPEVKADISDRLKNATFSATSLEKYKACPYQYFMEKVLGLKPIRPKMPEVEYKDRGTIIHTALELFFKQDTQTLFAHIRGEIPFEVIEKKMTECIETAIKTHSDLIAEKDTALIEYFKARGIATCIEAIKKEKELIEEMGYPLIPKYTEWSFGMEGNQPLVLNLPHMREPANLNGKVDRIDVDETHNTFSITDYKTGETQSVIGKIEKGEHLQLPIYIEAVSKLLLNDKRPVGAFLFSLKRIEKKHGLGIEEYRKFYFPSINKKVFVEEKVWQNLIDTALRFAGEYIEKIRSLEFREDISSCKGMCDYKEACRYAKR